MGFSYRKPTKFWSCRRSKKKFLSFVVLDFFEACVELFNLFFMRLKQVFVKMSTIVWLHKKRDFINSTNRHQHCSIVFFFLYQTKQKATTTMSMRVNYFWAIAMKSGFVPTAIFLFTPTNFLFATNSFTSLTSSFFIQFRRLSIEFKQGRRRRRTTTAAGECSCRINFLLKSSQVEWGNPIETIFSSANWKRLENSTAVFPYRTSLFVVLLVKIRSRSACTC